jgi:hypothetical protein
VPTASPRPGLPSAGRTPGIPLTTRPQLGSHLRPAGGRKRPMRHLDPTRHRARA